MNENKMEKLDSVVIRFSGDSGDGMQLTGTLFSSLYSATRLLPSPIIPRRYVLHKVRCRVCRDFR